MIWRLTWRNFRRRPWQTGLTVFVVGFCTTALVLCCFTVWSMERGAKGAVDTLGADIMVLPSSVEYEPGQVLFTGAPANIYMAEEVVEQIVAIPGVSAVSAQFFSQTLNESCCSLPEEYRLVGYYPDNDFLVQRLLLDGIGRELREREVVVGGGVPAFLGDRVVIHSQSFNVVGYLKPVGGSIDKTIFVPIETAREIVAASPYLSALWEEQGSPDELISAVLVQIEAGSDAKQIAKEIGKIPGVQAVVAAKMFADLKKQLQIFQVLSLMLAAIMIGLTLASLMSRYSSLVMERQEELGLMRALGLERGKLFGLVMAETLFTAFSAAIIGGLIGLGLIRYLKGLIEQHSSFPFLLPPVVQMAGIMAGIILGVLAISTLAALGPARVSANLDPVVVLTEGELK